MKQLIIASAIGTGVGNLVVTNNAGSDYFQLSCQKSAGVVADNFLIYRKNLIWTKTEYAVGTPFSVTITMPTSATAGKEYVFEIIKKGTVFNERNKWITSVVGASQADMAKKLIRNINIMDTCGLKASAVSTTGVKLDGKDFDDYVVRDVTEYTSEGSTAKPGIGSPTVGKPGVGDKAYMENLIAKTAAERGVDSTLIDGLKDGKNFYSNWAIANDGKYNIYNIKYTTPRYDHNIDEPLVQTLYVALPSTATATALETALKGTDTSTERTDGASPSAS